MNGVLNDDAQLFKLFTDSESFKRRRAGVVFNETDRPGRQGAYSDNGVPHSLGGFGSDRG